MDYEPRVYVLNYVGHDLTPAQQFTKHPLIYMTEGSVNTIGVDRLTYTLREVLADFTAEDYLLMSGSPVIAAVATAILIEKGIHDINVLVFHVRERRYFARRINGSGRGGIHRQAPAHRPRTRPADS